MRNQTVEVQLNSGLERLAAMLVQVASKYESRVYLESEGRKVNAKSIMGMMSLVLNNGESVEILADGSDEEGAVNAIADYLTGKNE